MKIEELPIPEDAKKIIIESGIRELYPPQIEAVKSGVLDGKNLVLASATASGKTLVAILCALKHAIEKGGKTLYLTPLKALASEKYEEFKRFEAIKKPNGKKIRVAISTGDYDSSDPHLGAYDIIVTTNEKADSLLRHRANWMSDVSLVVADEVHLLNDAGRGPTLEVVLARLVQINPEIQILALSATISNAREIADWLNAEVIVSDWRPVKLREGILVYDEVQFKDGYSYKIDVHKSSLPTVNAVIHTIKTGGQALIFLGTRRKAVTMAKRLSSTIKELISKPVKRALEKVADEILATGERTRLSELLAELVRLGVAFHHAGLCGAHRHIIEDAFRNGAIKALTATPTLAFGVNLPARTVIIHDYHRYEPGYGYYPISVLEYKQMAGRAGRPKFDKVGEALLIAKTEDERDYLMEAYIMAKPERIWSKLAIEKSLRNHVLATIASGFAYTERGVYEFFERTFYAHQYGARMIKGKIYKILTFLEKEDMINFNGEKVIATRFGRRVSELYIDPISAITIRDSLNRRSQKITDFSFLHMIASTPDMHPKLRPSRSEIDEIESFVDAHIEEFMVDLPSPIEDRIEYEEFLGEVKIAMVLKAWIEETHEDEILSVFGVQPGDLYRIVDAAKWLLYASQELAKLFEHRDLLPKISELMERVEKGVKPELLQLARLKGVGRIRARVLYNAGYKSIEDLKKAKIEELMSLPRIGAKLAMKIKEQVGGLLKKEDLRKVKAEWEQKALTEY